MRVLLVGGGGREHALAWTLSRSPELGELIAAPGSPGIDRLARRLPIGAGDVAGLVDAAAAERVDLVVAGPEAPLAEGLADRLGERGIPCFGPARRPARLEASKAFANDFCTRYGIPTGRYRVVREPQEAARVLRSGRLGPEVVVKASGLAGGKGVFLPDTLREAERQAVRLLEGGLGGAGRTVVLEERLFGPELSVFAITDGERILDCGTAEDFKRRFDGGRGPNTGGMGCVSPGRGDAALLRDVRTRILAPVVAGMRAEGTPYRGVLYAGLMLTADGPRVLEFNVRFGDPEAQALLPRLATDLLPVLFGAATGRLGDARIEFVPDHSVTVILAAREYPGPCPAGAPIRGLPRGVKTAGPAFVFHAGTRTGPSGVEAAGGRIIAVTGLGRDRAAAREAAYAAAETIRWEGRDFRTDIGAGPDDESGPAA